MRYLFTIYTAGCIAGGCSGSYHHFFLAACCLIVTLALWCEHRKEKRNDWPDKY